LYPGAMAAAMMVLLAQPNGGKVLVWYSIISFSNDSFAWLVGITLGKRRGIFLTSPNKSLEGFIAGMVGSVASSMLGPILFPSIVPRSWFLLALTGVVCGIAVVAGDLFESALKRSAKVKDSGNSIPGRGGFLDSFDSIAFAAPVFLVFAVLLGIV
ncbi:MAG TPA: phosphatidate cytidylyltransferase, partial [Spirochaetales bacterium]|nr:phosphatidate cytidylyltransferase [Spirochaetales bacterium]